MEDMKGYYKAEMSKYMDSEGRFPDSVLGDAIWPLYYCNKIMIGDELWWYFVD